MTKTYKLWARVGMTVEVTEDEKEMFLQNPEKYIKENLNTDKVRMDGETYFPVDNEDNCFIGVSEE